MKGLLVAAMMAAGLMLSAAPAADAAPRLKATVDLSEQMMTVTYDGKVRWRWPVSTARGGYVTPTGTWSPKRMERMWHSRKYNMSPMPYAIFYHGGYAIHGTGAVSRLGSPASHGCVRLATGNARKLYRLVQSVGASNMRVIVRR